MNKNLGKTEKKKVQTFAGTDEEVAIWSDRTIEQINDGARMAVANQRYRHSLLIHFSQIQILLCSTKYLSYLCISTVFNLKFYLFD